MSGAASAERAVLRAVVFSSSNVRIQSVASCVKRLSLIRRVPDRTARARRSIEAAALSQIGQSLQRLAVVEGEMLAGFVVQKRQVGILDDAHQLVAIHF